MFYTEEVAVDHRENFTETQQEDAELLKSLILEECTETNRNQLVTNAIKNDKIYEEKT